MDKRKDGIAPVAAVERTARTALTARWLDASVGRDGYGRHGERAAAVADALCVPPPLLTAFLQGQERLALVAAPTGAVRGVPVADLGFPAGPHGSPDAVALRAAGCWVRGAIPPSGMVEHLHLGSPQVAYYAAEVDLEDGAGPRFLRGAVLDAGAVAYGGVRDVEAYLAELQSVAGTVRRLPSSMAEFRARRREEFFGSRAGSRFDADL
ncbi:hypothetical protein NUM3379_08010 [Kineococcus sp. NUM-3379]